jgi:hypothetical protein
MGFFSKVRKTSMKQIIIMNNNKQQSMVEQQQSTDHSSSSGHAAAHHHHHTSSSEESGTTATIIHHDCHHRRRRPSICWLDASASASDEQLQEELRKQVTRMSPHEIVSQLEEMAMVNTWDGKRKMTALKQILMDEDGPPTEIQFEK